MAKLLILDDSREILEMLQAVLQMHRHTVAIVQTKHHFLNELHSNRPDLLLLDVSLKDCDGREICLEVKSSPDMQSIPIVLISANPKFLDTYEKFGADGILEKPFDINDLTGKINALLTTS
jgi:DNA-binding response OmpR family regulator